MTSLRKGARPVTGMERDEDVCDRDRWAAAVDRMAMALCEAGYPTRVESVSFLTGRENELVFGGRFPPRDVALRAGEMCGIRDLIEKAIVQADGWPGEVRASGRSTKGAE